jgi:hypothetical protein
VFLILAYGVSDDQVQEVMTSDSSDDELLQRITARGRAFMRAIEALLGVPARSLEGPDVDLLAGMIQAFRASEQKPINRNGEAPP